MKSAWILPKIRKMRGSVLDELRSVRSLEEFPGLEELSEFDELPEDHRFAITLGQLLSGRRM